MKFKKLILFSSLDFISGNYNSQIINFQDSLGIILDLEEKNIDINSMLVIR